MDYITDEIKTIKGGESELVIVVKRIEDLVEKLNTGKDVDDDSYNTRYRVVIVLQNEEYGVLDIDKNHSGAYRVRLERK